jgi:hypothetical protein
MPTGEPSATWHRYGALAGIVFVVALIVDLVVTSGIPINQNDSAAKIAELDQHSTRLIVVACVGVVYAAAFLIYAWLGYVAIVAAIGLFVQGFGLGGVIADFGLVFDLVGFGLFMIFVLASSIVMLRREGTLGRTPTPS